MKVFVSGVAGFLGSHLAQAYLRRGDEVWGCDNLITGLRENVPDGVCFAVLDCRTWKGCRRPSAAPR